PQPGRSDTGCRTQAGDTPDLSGTRRPGSGGQSVRIVGIRRTNLPVTARGRPRQRCLSRFVFEDLRLRPSRGVGTGTAGGSREARTRGRVRDVVSTHAQSTHGVEISRDARLAGSDQNLPGKLPGTAQRDCLRVGPVHACRVLLDVSRGWLLRVADSSGRCRCQGDAAASGGSTCRICAGNRILRRWRGTSADATVLLLPNSRTNPRGCPTTGRSCSVRNRQFVTP